MNDPDVYSVVQSGREEYAMNDLFKLTERDVLQSFVISLFNGVRSHVCEEDRKHVGEPGYKFGLLDMRKSWPQMNAEERAVWQNAVARALAEAGVSGETVQLILPIPLPG